MHHVYRFKGRTGSGRILATAAVYGLVMDRPRLRGRLLDTNRALAGWEKLHSSEHAQPLSWPLTCTIAAVMLKRVGGVPRPLPVGFDCYCRRKS